MKNYLIILLLFLATFYGCSNNKKVDINLKDDIQSEKFCYIKNVEQKSDTAKANIYVDFIEYEKKSDLDSTISKEQIIELPNGYCYVNENSLTESFLFNNSTKITMQTFSYSNEGNFNFNQTISLNQFVKEFSKPEPLPFKFSVYKITIRGNKIDSLTEIYIP